MKLDEFVGTVKDAITVRRVFAEPYERDGVTVIAAAAVAGGGGGGGGHDREGQEGEGGGFGVVARPVGVYVVEGGRVRWRPAVDVDRAITTLGLIVIVWMVTRLRRERLRDRAARRAA